MSTSQAFVELLDDITHSLKYKKCAMGVFIDLKKATLTNVMAFVEMHVIGLVVT